MGKYLVKGGKIILVGCNMGKGNYARSVAVVAGATVYAAKNKFAAADTATVVQHVNAIEGGKPLSPMAKFTSLQ